MHGFPKGRQPTMRCAATFLGVFFAESNYGAKKNGHVRFCCSMTLRDRKTLNKQHRNLLPSDIEFLPQPQYSPDLSTSD